MKITMKDYNAEGEEILTNGQLNLVDLAGWDKVREEWNKQDIDVNLIVLSKWACYLTSS